METRAFRDVRGPCILAIDIGSSSVRAQVYDANGTEMGYRPARDDWEFLLNGQAFATDEEIVQVLAAHPGDAQEFPVNWRTFAADAMEVNATELVNTTFRAIDYAIEVADDARFNIVAVALDTFWHGLMGVYANGAPVTPLFAWGDTRARNDAAALRERIDAAAVHARTGCFVHESYPAAKLVWLRRAAGDSFSAAASWLSIGEHLCERLFGVRRTSLSMASGTGLLDVARCRWDEEMLAAVGIRPDLLPELSDEPMVGLRPDFARRWPELARVPWFPALGDGACATVGSGADRPGTIALTVGTSAAVRMLREGAVERVPEGLWLYRVDARRSVAGRALSNAGNVFKWLRLTLDLPRDRDLEALLAAAEHDPVPRLPVLPQLVGERPPLSERDEIPAIQGSRMAATPLDRWRAWMEVLATRLAQAVAAVEAEYGRADEIVGSGGALHASPVFRRVVERVLGRPLTMHRQGNDTARGAALIVTERLGA